MFDWLMLSFPSEDKTSGIAKNGSVQRALRADTLQGTNDVASCNDSILSSGGIVQN
jgi:hypothetical protein